MMVVVLAVVVVVVAAAAPTTSSPGIGPFCGGGADTAATPSFFFDAESLRTTTPSLLFLDSAGVMSSSLAGRSKKRAGPSGEAWSTSKPKSRLLERLRIELDVQLCPTNTPTPGVSQDRAALAVLS